MWMGTADIQVDGNGIVGFSMARRPEQGVHSSEHALSQKNLAELARLLEQTQWLTKPGAEPQAPGTDATYVDLVLRRDGKEAKARFHTQAVEPYRSLGYYLLRLQRQERVLAQLVSASAEDRSNGSQELLQDLDKAEAGRPNPWDLVLDFGRFVPDLGKVLADPAGRPARELLAAVRLMGHLKVESQQANLAALARGQIKDPPERFLDVRLAAIEALSRFRDDRAFQVLVELQKDAGVRGAIAEAIFRIDPVKAIPHLKELTRDQRPAAWCLIRAGEPAVPAILDVLNRQGDSKDSGAYYVIREYFEHEKELPGKIDPNVLDAIEECVEFRGSEIGQYGLEVLSRAGRKLKPSDARQAVSRYLGKLAADDTAAAIRLIGQNPMLMTQCPDEFYRLAIEARLEIRSVHAGKSAAWAVLEDRQRRDDDRQYLAYMNGSGGVAWTLAYVMRDTPQKVLARAQYHQK
jgi:hypothetical protein